MSTTQGEAPWAQGITLAEWLIGTSAGTVTVDTLLDSQPAVEHVQ
ncbi:hypothetical protein [Streptomyces sp. NPDC001480]